MTRLGSENEEQNIQVSNFQFVILPEKALLMVHRIYAAREKI